MRALTIALIASTLYCTCVAAAEPLNTPPQVNTETRDAGKDRTERAQDPFTRAAQGATKAATPGAIKMAKFLKQHGVIHKDAVIAAPPVSR